MARKPKKRGPKPGVKRGPYKKNKTVRTKIPNAEWRKLLDSATTSVDNLPSLISDLTSTIDTLEAQLTAQIDRIKSILN